MKVHLLFTIFFVFFLGIAACSPDTNTPPVDKPEVGEENPQDKEVDKQYGNEAFKEVTVSESEGKMLVKGKARVFEGVFQFALLSDGQIIMQDHYQTDGAPAWGDFEISFNKELVSQKETFIELFVYSAKDGSKTDILTIPIK